MPDKSAGPILAAQPQVLARRVRVFFLKMDILSSGENPSPTFAADAASLTENGKAMVPSVFAGPTLPRQG